MPAELIFKGVIEDKKDPKKTKNAFKDIKRRLKNGQRWSPPGFNSDEYYGECSADGTHAEVFVDAHMADVTHFEGFQSHPGNYNYVSREIPVFELHGRRFESIIITGSIRLIP